MSVYSGYWNLDIPLYCTKELSGKKIKCYIYDKPVLMWFPSLPENSNEKELVAPLGIMQNKLDWGEVHSWDEGMFCVRALMFCTNATESVMQSIYEVFPKWRKKLNTFIMLQTGNFTYIEQKKSMLLQHNFDTYDNLHIFEVNPDEELMLIDNNYEVQDIQIQMIECFNLKKMEQLFKDISLYGEIPVWYELVINSYHAAMRQDYRSAVIIMEKALENVILSIIEYFYYDNEMESFECDKKQYQTLDKLFEWLNSLQIEISINNYQKDILEKLEIIMYENPNYEDIKKYLDKCRLIIQEFDLLC